MLRARAQTPLGSAFPFQAAGPVEPSDLSQPPTIMTVNIVHILREKDSLSVTGAGRRELNLLTLSPRVVTASRTEALSLQNFSLM